MLIFRVREYTRPSGYWVYCSNEINDYREALIKAIELEKLTGIRNFVDLITA